MNKMNFSDTKVTSGGRAPNMAVCRSAGSHLRIRTRQFCCVLLLLLLIFLLLLLLLLLILQSFDWLAAFHLELLQAILFVAV